MKKRLSLALAVALALVLLTAVAFALTRGFGLFDLMSQHKTEEFTVVQPEAYELLKTDLAQARFGDMDANNHLNNVALESLHENTRAGLNRQTFPEIYDRATRTVRIAGRLVIRAPLAARPIVRHGRGR